MPKLSKAALIVTTLTTLTVPLCRADSFTVTLTRFGTCLGSCEVVITDNGPLDLNPAPGIIDFSVPLIGESPGGVFTASGQATETLTHDAAGKVTGILMNLTNSTVQGLSGGIGNAAVIPGAIGMISSVPLVTLDGVAGFGLVERPVPKLYGWRYHVRRSHCSGFTGRMHSRVGPREAQLATSHLQHLLRISMLGRALCPALLTTFSSSTLILM